MRKISHNNKVMEKNGIQIKSAIILSFVIIALSLISCRLGYKMIDRRSPTEYVSAIHSEDSLFFVRYNKDLAKEYVNEYIRNKKDIIGGIEYAEYDKELDAYFIHYWYVKRCFLDQEGVVHASHLHDRYMWIRYEFKVNDGDYKITPKIIKNVRPKKEGEKNYLFNAKHHSHRTYEK